jgi:hypothetical protein
MPSHDSDWFRKDNGASGKQCDMDEKPEGSIRGNELINDVHWQFGVPPRGNANFAWVQHFIHHLAPHGMAGFVLVRFWLWVKHGCHRARSRDETGQRVMRVQRLFSVG